MMTQKASTQIADPKTGGPAEHSYPIYQGVNDLLDQNRLDPVTRKEIRVFDSLPTAGHCYFRHKFMTEIAQGMSGLFPERQNNISLVEIGGGEGFLAKAFKKENPDGCVYVCDLSMTHLRQAPNTLVKIRCDARFPYLLPESVDIAAFWVSLHHFPPNDMRKALEQAAICLKPRGSLIFFEPNALFLPRQILLHTPLKRLVYFDDDEKPINFTTLKRELEAMGLKMACSFGINPPYNYDFLRKLPGGLLFAPILEGLYKTDRLSSTLLQEKIKAGEHGLRCSSYVFARFLK